jgi:thioredoxin reductase
MLFNFEYLIIGGGPAGLQLGYFLEKANHNYMILESGDSPGTFFKKYPRHGKLISINKVYTGYEDTEINLRWDWNSLISDSEEMLFKHYSRDYFPHTDDLVRYLKDFADYFKLKIKYNSKIINITKKDKFVLTDNNGDVYLASRLIIATGLSKPYIPPIPGIELAENYTDVSINPEDFANQRVLIIGKGNSGFETADNIVGTASMIHIASPSPLSMAWRTKYVGHLRAVNNNFLDTYQLKSQNGVIDAHINKIEHLDCKYIASFSYTHANGEKEKIIYDRVINCTGFRFDDSIFDKSSKPDLTINERFPNLTSEWESSNIKDLYFAGVLTHMRDYKAKQSGFIHGFRYNARILYHMLENKYHEKSLPYQLITPTAKHLTDIIIQRINISSGLWQQTGFLCDIIAISEDAKIARYYRELPKEYIQDSELGECKNYYTISLEFGYQADKMPEPFSINRVHKNDAKNSSHSVFIHPIIRHFCGKTMIAEHHVIEDFASEWLEDVHIKPLLEFLSNQLSNNLSLEKVA